MNCPSCQHPENIVVDSRDTSRKGIRRRRECLSCATRWTTYEEIHQETPGLRRLGGAKKETEFARRQVASLLNRIERLAATLELAEPGEEAEVEE